MSTTPPDTQLPPQPGPDSGPRVTWDDIRDLAAIRRTTGERRRVAGVAGGLARHLDIDPLIVRVAFVVFTFFGGAGLLLYIACWLLVPEEGSDWARVPFDRRSRNVALLLVGVLVLLLLASHTWWGSGFPWTILVIAGIIALVASAFPRRERRPSAQAPQAPMSPGVEATQATQATMPYAGSVPPASPAFAAAGTGYSPVAPPPVRSEQPRPVNPRKKGPILFWFALAVMAVSLGVLAVVDLAGAPVAPSTYPAVVLALSGIFLVIGSFWGRAGGIILVGLIAAMTTAGVTVVDRWDPHRDVNRPLTSAAVLDTYHLDSGNLVLDLTDVGDPQQLDGRTIDVSGGVGQIDITVPADLTVVVDAAVSGPGGISLFGQDTGGVDTTSTVVHSGGAGAPRLVIDANLHVGAINAHAEANVRRSLR